MVQKIFDIGFVPAVKVKETFRTKVSHAKGVVRKVSRENYERYGKERYRIESLFGTTKQKLGLGFRVIREDTAIKIALACAILWNFYPAKGGTGTSPILDPFLLPQIFQNP